MVDTTSSDTAAAVEKLNAGWRNYLCNAMKLDPNTFQLAQGSLGLQTSDSSGLFLMSDAVPPASTVGYYDATSMNKRSANFLELLEALLPEVSPNGLQTALGDGYAAWVAWKKSNPPQSGDTLLSYFKRFELTSDLDPGVLSRGETAITAALNSPLNRAWTAYNNASNYQSFVAPSGTSYTLPIYNVTNAAALAQINQGGSVSIDFDSYTMDSSAKGTFAEGHVGGFFDIFSAGASGSFSQQNDKASTSRFTIQGTINKMATLPTSAGAWYSSNEVQRAFNGQGNAQIWDPNATAGDWDAFFGDTGGLARFVSQLVLVSDYSITVTSHATYEQSDLQKIQAQADIGFWPFFSASASASQTTSYTLNSDSTLSATQTLGKGLIQIWGVTIQPAP